MLKNLSEEGLSRSTPEKDKAIQSGTSPSAISHEAEVLASRRESRRLVVPLRRSKGRVMAHEFRDSMCSGVCYILSV